MDKFFIVCSLQGKIVYKSEAMKESEKGIPFQDTTILKENVIKDKNRYQKCVQANRGILYFINFSFKTVLWSQITNQVLFAKKECVRERRTAL